MERIKNLLKTPLRVKKFANSVLFDAFFSLIAVFITLSCQAQFKINELDNTPPHATIHSDFVSVTNNINLKNGPQGITRNFIEDKNGHVWIASWEGIFKFNGNSFTSITKSVSMSRFYSLLEDSKGNFWFGSIGYGVFYFDGSTYQNFTTKDGLVHNSVKDIREDSNGNIWFATQGGVSFYDGTRFHNFTTDDGLLHNDSNWIFEDEAGKFWFASRGQISIYDGKEFSEFKNTDGRSFSNIRSIIKDKKGHIWLGGEQGLWRYDGQSLINISHAFVGFIYEDKKGAILVAAHGAKGSEIIRYDEDLTPTQIGTIPGMIFGLLEDKFSHLWIGTLNGICIYDQNKINCP